MLLKSPWLAEVAHPTPSRLFSSISLSKLCRHHPLESVKETVSVSPCVGHLPWSHRSGRVDHINLTLAPYSTPPHSPNSTFAPWVITMSTMTRMRVYKRPYKQHGEDIMSINNQEQQNNTGLTSWMCIPASKLNELWSCIWCLLKETTIF